MRRLVLWILSFALVTAAGATKNFAQKPQSVPKPSLKAGDEFQDDDNCPGRYNPSQSDYDMDGVGDACATDPDRDGIDSRYDNCPDRFNPEQEDADGDEIGDVCDF